MNFWIALGVVAVLATAWLLRPLFRAAVTAAPASDYDIEVYRDQLRELERDVERGLIDRSEADAARTEIQRRLLTAADQEEKTSTGGRGGRHVLAAILLVAVPVVSVGLYLHLGRPGMPDLPLAQRQLPTSTATTGAAVMEAGEAVAQLEARVAENPADVAAWIDLARNYRSLGQFADAARAFGKAREVTGDHPIILSAYGEALVMAAGGTVTSEAVEVFEKILATAPGDQRALLYLGVARDQAGDAAGALEKWLLLEASAPANAQWLAPLRQRMQSVAETAGIDLAALRAARGPIAAPPAPPHPMPGSGPSAADMQAAQQMAPSEQQEMIRSMVDRLAERLQEEPDDIDGWRRLARAYEVLGETDKAQEAAARVNALTAGQPGQSAVAPPPAAATTPPGHPPASEVDNLPIAGMLRDRAAKLAARLEQQPDDLEGWSELGRSYMELEEPGKAADAYARATALAPENVELLIDYGDALLAANGHSGVLPEPFVAVMRNVLALDSGNPLALWYVGLGEAQAGNTAAARTMWTRLVEILPADAPERADVQRSIKALPSDN